jgi:hypothetical protein
MIGNQKKMEDYIYMVPHVIQKETIFLKTIIPSRKATKAYEKSREDQHEIR